jgi:23S rRNA pseudouridine1911/1915/1917 synthase
MSRSRTHTISEEETRLRLDRTLARVWPDLTRSRIQALIRDGRVRLDGRTAKSSELPVLGARVDAELPEPDVLASSRLAPESIPLSIVYEDDDLLVVDKPAGLVVHPGAGVSSGTLVHALLAHCPTIEGVGGSGRPGLVHRLDRGTTGLLVVAKTEAAWRGLTKDLAERTIRRSYLTIVWGVPDPREGRIEAAIARDRKDRTRMAVVPAGKFGARAAATNYRVLAPLPTNAMRPRFSLVECRLETGRTHQIRVHFASRKHPVVGDATYGGGAKKALSLPPEDRRLATHLVKDLGRPALHAVSLELRHPTRGEVMTFQASLPHDMARALSSLGLFSHPACP